MAESGRRILESGMAALSLSCTDDQVSALLSYVDLLERWNRAYNLTAVRGRDNMIVRHLLDSLAIVPLIHGETLIDVGTGAGLPGVPLAVMLPQTRVALLDSNGKKTRFLFQVKTRLGLSNIDIVESRVEDYRPTTPFDAVVSRAFSGLGDFAGACAHLVADGGTLYAMKGAQASEEIGALDDTVEVVANHELQVPGLDEARYLVAMKNRRSMVQG